MENIFYKLSTDFKFDFDIEYMLSKFVCDLSNPNEKNSFHPKPFNSPTGILHWQFSPIDNSRFARNVYKNLKYECDAIADNLTRLQSEIKNSDNILATQFLNHTFTGSRVGIIKLLEGQSVRSHIDSYRRLALNIGLKNSATCRTCIEDQSFVMQDNDVYILNTSLRHSVESTVTNGDRYIISYTII
jgi:hypothetical protein